LFQEKPFSPQKDTIMAKTTILLEGLIVRFHVGVPKQERADDQPIHLDIRCELGQLPITRDHLKQTLNYASIYARVHELAKAQTFILLETLTEAIAHICFADPRVLHVHVKARKPNKLIGCEFVGVEREFDRTEVPS
jgi:dihydroneopterin aldolase